MHLSGLLTLALNIAEPLAAGHYGRAAVDTVAPVLLLGWGAVGPQLLRHLHAATRPAPVGEPAAEPTSAPPLPPAPAPPAAPTQPKESGVAVPEPLMEAARSIAAAYLSEHGRPITAGQLRTRLGVALPLATAAHAQLTA